MIQFVTGAFAALFLIGCQPGVRRAGEPVCPGKESIAAAVSVLSAQRQSAQPLRAFADCTFYYNGDDGGQKRQKIDHVTVRFIPPDKILFRGIEFGEVGFGANENEFWVRVKPDLDSTWWGTRQQIERCAETMLVNPYNVIEALGTVEVSTDWKLSNKRGYDVLTLMNGKKPRKRVFVEPCDYRVRRIEYFDNDGYLKAAADLSDYEMKEDLVVPSRIEATSYDRGIKEYYVEIALEHIGVFKPTDKQREQLFVRPERGGFEFVYQLTEACEFVEE